MLCLAVIGLIMLSLFLMKVLKLFFVKLKSNAPICQVRIILVNEIVGSSEYLCSAGGKFVIILPSFLCVCVCVRGG